MAWQPMKQGNVNPDMLQALDRAGETFGHGKRIEAWGNNLYDALVRRYPDGHVHISFKRHDREAVHDWRHMQAIKNDVVGPEALFFELYPPESKLVDTSNEYHLWGWEEDAIAAEPFMAFVNDVGCPTLMDAAEVEDFNRRGGGGKGKQRTWEPGLTTGLGRQP